MHLHYLCICFFIRLHLLSAFCPTRTVLYCAFVCCICGPVTKLTIQWYLRCIQFECFSNLHRICFSCVTFSDYSLVYALVGTNTCLVPTPDNGVVSVQFVTFLKELPCLLRSDRDRLLSRRMMKVIVSKIRSVVLPNTGSSGAVVLSWLCLSQTFALSQTIMLQLQSFSTSLFLLLVSVMGLFTTLTPDMDI